MAARAMAAVSIRSTLGPERHLPDRHLDARTGRGSDQARRFVPPPGEQDDRRSDR